jgi:hypothetical protein
MKNIFSINSMFLVRAVLLFGLLNGLLFSCGEGIRLFPFPTSEAASQIEFETKINNGTDYEKNFHRFENQFANYQQKNQQNNSNHWLNNGSLIKSLSEKSKVISSKTDSTFHADLIISRLSDQSFGSRAPPLT